MNSILTFWELISSKNAIITYACILMILMIFLIFSLLRLDSKKKSSTKNRFYYLKALDTKEVNNPDNLNITLRELSSSFRDYMASNLNLYYKADTIDTFVAYFGVSHLIILEGVSGTGKTSLAYAFSCFLGKEAAVIPVEPMWKEKTDILGYYNDFTNKYNETPLLCQIYESNLVDRPFISILDEMNIARIEYYFADILSLLELPNDMNKRIKIVGDYQSDDPKNLYEGCIELTNNNYFIGTANKDDSTFAISDKVYDRAMVLYFDKINESYRAPATKPIDISYKEFNSLYSSALEEYRLTKRSLNKLKRLEDYLIKNFNISFGNRIMRQINKFSAIYMSLEHSELEGIDIMLSTKILRLLDKEGHLKLKKDVPDLKKFINTLFGDYKMPKSQEHLDRLIR